MEEHLRLTWIARLLHQLPLPTDERLEADVRVLDLQAASDAYYNKSGEASEASPDLL
jgi:hypothetical protein